MGATYKECHGLSKGTSNIQGHYCGIHPGGVEVAGQCSEDPVQGSDAGELWSPNLSGLLCE
ncbi:hypothetical protein MUG91_G257n8 [Manis pentadactyla]|nr:hypothetical protein MUG91_G257n8 [Manis pentadactyla]